MDHDLKEIEKDDLKGQNININNESLNDIKQNRVEGNQINIEGGSGSGAAQTNPGENNENKANEEKDKEKDSLTDLDPVNNIYILLTFNYLSIIEKTNSRKSNPKSY